MQNSLKCQKGIKIPADLFHKNGLNQNCVFSDIKYKQNIALQGFESFLAIFCLFWTYSFGSSRLFEMGQLGIFIHFLYFSKDSEWYILLPYICGMY